MKKFVFTLLISVFSVSCSETPNETQTNFKTEDKQTFGIVIAFDENDLTGSLVGSDKYVPLHFSVPMSMAESFKMHLKNRDSFSVKFQKICAENSSKCNKVYSED